MGRNGSIESTLKDRGAEDCKNRVNDEHSQPAQFARFHNVRSLGVFDTDLTSVQQSTGDGGVGINTPVAQEWPVAANVLEGLQVDIAH